MWKEPFTYVVNILPITQSALGTTFQDYPIKIASDAHFEMIRSIYQADDGRINLKIINSSDGQQIIKYHGDVRAVSSTALNGITANGFTPYNFSRPYMIPANSELLISAADFSNTVGGNNFRLAIHGNKVYGGKAPYEDRKKREVYSFIIDSGTVAAYDTVTQVYVLDSSAGYLISKLTGDSTGKGTIFIQDQRPWCSQDVHFYNMVGNSQFGNLLTSKRWMPEKTRLTVRFSDLSGAANRFKVTFHGERVLLT